MGLMLLSKRDSRDCLLLTHEDMAKVETAGIACFSHMKTWHKGSVLN